ncbi:MAG: hypothetical protein WC933_02720 [Candidatus Paceibacterota bacterium]|jgi:hypothetical protein
MLDSEIKISLCSLKALVASAILKVATEYIRITLNAYLENNLMP